MIFDTHAHYYDEAFDADRAALLASLPGRGVALVVCPAATRVLPPVHRPGGAVRLSLRRRRIPPENLEGAALSDLDAVKALCAHPKVVAVGRSAWTTTGSRRRRSGPTPGLFRRPALPGGGTQPPRHRPRPGRPPGLPGHRPRPPRRPGGVPLLLRQPGGR